MRRRASRVLGLLVAVASLGTASTAFAAWAVNGVGSSWSGSRVMPTGNTPTATVSGRNVTASWTASAFLGGPNVEGYVVHRYAAGGGLQVILASCSGVVSGLSCVEHAVPSGSWQYTVAPAQGNWRGAESARSASVDVGSPTLVLSPSNPPVTLPATLTGSIANFVDGQSLSFHLDSVGGATLSGTVDGSPTPAPVPTGGSANVTVSLPSSGIADGSHTVVAVASGGDTASAGFVVDATGPSVAATFPTGGGTYNAAGWNAGCSTPGGDVCGTASDGSGSGVASVQVSLRRVSSGLYWNGSSFGSSSEVLLTATGTTSWTLAFSASSFPADGSYTVRAVAADAVGNTGSTSMTFAIDTAAPAPAVIDSSPGNPTIATSATVTFHDTEAGVTFQCQLDGGGFSACASPKTYAGPLSDGSHTFQVKAVDEATNESSTASFTWIVDTTAPTAAVTFPTSGGTYNNATWTAGCGTSGTDDLCGTASDGGTGSGVASVQVSIRQGSGNYWNGSSFGSASEVLITATGTTSWSLPFAATNFPAAGSFTVRAVATDNVGLTVSTSITFAIDRTAPVLSTLQMFDTNANGKVDRVVATFDETLAACTAPCTTGWTLANVPSGGTLSSVSVTGTAATLTVTEGAGAANTAVGSFTVALAASSGIQDAAGNHPSFAATAPADKASPVPVSMTNANGNGTPANGDTYSIVFSEKLSVATVCSTWSNDNNDQTVSTNNVVTVTVTDGGAGNDTLTVSTTSGACGGAFHFGSVNLGSGGFVTSTRTFSGSGSNKSQIDWTVSSLTLKITLGTASGSVGTVSGSVTATYTPDTSIKDPSTNVVTGTISRTGVQF